ncbi:regulator of replication initiation timing [Rhizobium sp. BK316]|uniref:AAA family ATPase n=1 Tax=Rhizobium sp. BK316 TaxID=2587053 RepID=UPI0016074721|nr:AAA family ATPase [Rhizobium sp. BK316]MBB3410012.1 regulator of replication initiation timing [Rhizobium sp. BK316]
MTMFKPNLAVEDMRVFSKGRPVFSEKFHAGLNIIRGQNSSGKSTIMDFLFFGLGGDLLETQWRESALHCDSVILGARLNGRSVTLARDIEPKASRPMRIFFGPIDEALSSAAEGWERYPFSRGSAESFSQVMFRHLGLPEVQYGESNTKITMNQILRLLYSDQLSAVDKIFRPQRFDDAITRQTVGDLLCGAYSNSYYNARIRKKDAEAELKEVVSRIGFLIRTHGREGHPLTLEWLNAERERLEGDLNRLNQRIGELEEQIFKTQFDDRLTLNDQNETYDRVVQLQTELGKLKQELDEAELERLDSIDFIASLDKKLKELEQSQDVIAQMDAIAFEFCPSCFAPVEHNHVEGSCSLCKSPYDHSRTQQRVLKLINEYSRQRDNSATIQHGREDLISHLKSKIESTTELWRQAARHYTVAVRTPTTELRLELRQLNREAGYAHRQLEELASKKAIITELAELSESRDVLEREIDQLKVIIENEERRNHLQKARAAERIEKEVLDFLKKDLERQSTFVSADRINFEFDGDRLAVNDESFFSASSMVYLRNSFLAGFMYAAANDSTFSHPRFLLMDTVEDKGMEPERSKNFQRLLYSKSQSAISDHQIIIATSMIADELNNPSITVGEFYTHDNRTLKL